MKTSELIALLEEHFEPNFEVLIEWEGQKIPISTRDITQDIAEKQLLVWADNQNYACMEEGK